MLERTRKPAKATSSRQRTSEVQVSEASKPSNTAKAQQAEDAKPAKKASLNAQLIAEALASLMVGPTLISDFEIFFILLFPRHSFGPVRAVLQRKAAQGEMMLHEQIDMMQYYTSSAVEAWRTNDIAWQQVWSAAKAPIYKVMAEPRSWPATQLCSMAQQLPDAFLLLFLLEREPYTDMQWIAWHTLLQGIRPSKACMALCSRDAAHMLQHHPERVQRHVLALLLQEMCLGEEAEEAEIRQFLLSMATSLPHLSPTIHALLAVRLLWAAKPEHAAFQLQFIPQGPEHLGIQAWIDWQLGKADAGQCLQRLLQVGNPDVSECLSGPFWLLCLHKVCGEADFKPYYKQLFPNAPGSGLLPFAELYRSVNSLSLHYLRTALNRDTASSQERLSGLLLYVMIQLRGGADLLLDADLFIQDDQEMEEVAQEYADSSVASISPDLLAYTPSCGPLADLLASKLPLQQYWVYQPKQQHADTRFNQFKQLLHSIAQPAAAEPQYKIAYVWEDTLVPYLQKMGKRGWTRGSRLSWDEFQRMQTQLPAFDREIAGYAQLQERSWYAAKPDLLRVLTALQAGGQLLNTDRVPVQLEIRPPRLLLERRQQDLWLHFDQPIASFEVPYRKVLETWPDKPYWPYEWLDEHEERLDGSMVMYCSEGDDRLTLIHFSPEQRALAQGMDAHGLFLPLEWEGRMAELLPSLGAVHISPDLPILGKDVQGLEPDSRPLVQLLPAHDGLRARLWARPFGELPPLLPLGSGERLCYQSRDGQTLHTQRDLAQERAALERLVQACPYLSEWLQDPGMMLDFEDLNQCLELLEQLQAQQEGGKVWVEWPEGQHLSLRRDRMLDRLELEGRRETDWFALDGQVQVNEGEVWTLQQLLQLATPQTRFLSMDGANFIKLSERLRRQLDLLRPLYDQDEQAIQLHPMMVGPLSEQLQGLKGDQAWQLERERMLQAQALQPQLPAQGFGAELRPYQRTGYDWMCRLAAWGAGACLADDMGLGKTVQALALLCDRAQQGPALVLAPTSVTANWMEEVHRFAPGLRPYLLSEVDREQTIGQLGPGDLLIVSYGLLVQTIDQLAAVRFATLVLDEAQSIKNTATQRYKAALRLQGDFRLLLSGTPIENHLGELWSLFSFLVPGLLGSEKHFRQRFAIPIGRGDQQRAAHLRALLQPFVLRRKKQDVLTDLPAKTEIVHKVPLSAKERAFYEALRRNALEALSQAEDRSDYTIRIFAELTRLRRACCNPRLVEEHAQLPSAKQEAFMELVEELMDNGHRALVFSQFVGHLSLLREQLDARQIAYQYLDGSTPLPQRKRAVAEFQQGDAPLFLISLKAGGTGLNLTAADYVIHMDPWWNPAVEDQASDRAHRIGQQRPVTVYRLVTEQTIEEKIMALHAEKRELADNLLEGTDTVHHVDPEQLMALLREE